MALATKALTRPRAFGVENDTRTKSIHVVPELEGSFPDQRFPDNMVHTKPVVPVVGNLLDIWTRNKNQGSSKKGLERSKTIREQFIPAVMVI